MSKIEWTGQTWNPVAGCTVHSPGCTNCYAMRMAARLEAMGVAHYIGTTRKVNGKPVWTGQLNLSENALLKPFQRRKPTTWFVNSMSDLFHEDMPEEWIDRVFAVMALCPQHTFQVLTKRSGRMREYMQSLEAVFTRAFAPPHQHPTFDDPHASFFAIIAPHTPAAWPLPNVWLGVSVEDQTRWDERTDDLKATPAAVRFVSAEPLLGPLQMNLGAVHHHPDNDPTSAAVQTIVRAARRHLDPGAIDWVIAGGESGPGSRPMHPDWARSLRDQCKAAGVPFFFKQWGEWASSTCQGNSDGGISFEPALGGNLAKVRLWQGFSTRGFGDGETVSSFFKPGSVLASRIGKKAAGHLLDGIEHRELPR